MAVRHSYLFNFAASYSSGGHKRLYAFAKWFNANGGAWFIIHSSCAELIRAFPVNRFFVVAPSLFERLYNDCAYLSGIRSQIGMPELYYANGIPLYSRVGKLNWFNLTNVAPLSTKPVPLSPLQRVKGSSLGRRIRAGLVHADVISAESMSSLQLLGGQPSERLFLSENGNDDELAELNSTRTAATENVATVVGTVAYKNLEQSFQVFQMLRRLDGGLQLALIGNPKWVPRALRNQPGVRALGYLPRAAVMERLRASRYYISTTCIEGSYNAAAEGIFLAPESYISDIAPHRELLRDEAFREVSVPGMDARLLHVRRAELSGVNLKTWDLIIRNVIARVRETIDAPSQGARRAG